MDLLKYPLAKLPPVYDFSLITLREHEGPKSLKIKKVALQSYIKLIWFKEKF